MANRILTFRAWAVASKKMFYPSTEDGWELVHGTLTPLPNTIIMQATGLKDKAGNEIYEGDIVKGVWHGKSNDKEIFGVVDFNEGMFGLENTIDGENYTINRLYIEVIGNIYEHPELLK